MAPAALGHATQPSSPVAISLDISRWCARFALGSIVLVWAMQTLAPGSPAFLVGGTIHAGSAIVLGLLATAALAALRGRTRLARTTSLVSILLGAALILGRNLAGVAGALGDAAGPGWRPVGHAATIHVMLGVALFATLRPSHRLVLPRFLGLATGGLAPLVSLSVTPAVVRGTRCCRASFP